MTTRSIKQVRSKRANFLERTRRRWLRKNSQGARWGLCLRLDRYQDEHPSQIPRGVLLKCGFWGGDDRQLWCPGLSYLCTSLSYSKPFLLCQISQSYTSSIHRNGTKNFNGFVGGIRSNDCTYLILVFRLVKILLKFNKTNPGAYKKADIS